MAVFRIMNLLLDTCGLLALASGTLQQAGAKALQSANIAVVSPVVPWELAIKVKVGKLILPEPPLVWVSSLVSRHQLHSLDHGLSASLLCAAADLPLIHRDPFDRVLIATALQQNLTILTSDRSIPTYPGIKTVW